MKKNRLFTKAIAMVLAIMTIFSVTSAGFTASAMDMENASKKAAKALITTGAGKIPVIGAFAKSALDPILSELFGIKSDTAVIIEKLDEISTKLDDLEESLKKNTQDIMKILNDEKYAPFNSSITSLRTMVENKYNFLKNIEESGDSDYTKMVMTANMLEFNMDNADEFAVFADTLKSFADGSQIKFGTNSGIYEYVLMSKCSDAVIGGNAAIRAAGYVNEINDVLSSAYKLMIVVLGEKVRMCEAMKNGEIDKACENDEELRNALGTINPQTLNCYKMSIYRNYWTELLGGENGSEGFIGDYDSMFNEENPDSTVSKYNAKVESIWFSYIRNVEYVTDGINVTFVPLNREISYTTVDKSGLNTSAGRYQVESMIKKTTSNINAKVTSVLTKAEVRKLYETFIADDILSKDENGERLTLLDAFRDYGFTCDAWEDSEEGKAIHQLYVQLANIFAQMGIKTTVADKYYITPLFVLEAGYKYINVDNSTQCYWDAKGNVKYFSGYSTSEVYEIIKPDGTKGYDFTGTTTQYYSFHQARGCDSDIVTSSDVFGLMYFTAA